jgi:hypothetical protein
VRGRVTAALICSAALAALAAGLAGAQYYAFCPFNSSLPVGCGPGGNITFQLDGGLEPRKLPRGKKVPVALEIRGVIRNRDGTHVPALREAVFDFDKHGAIEVRGLPVCGRTQLEGRVTGEARHLCRAAIVGRGTAEIEMAATETKPVRIPVRLTLFNGGVAAGVTKLFIHATVQAPEPLPTVAAVTIEETDRGRYGLASVTRIPQLFDGAGSLIGFDLQIGRRYGQARERSYLMARCFDGRLNTKLVEANFIDEATGPRTKTTLSATVIRACTAQGDSPGR